eukprot:gnl/TRDRNA2_/TRDRNA2_173422_c5_seq1.p1 gnl/TRDRNA2_/TRDRNA2_173422_c5~~gnl/TRDRNA2_/TRDRNA2_173422_c5_seq1.p1  ORF type:complete len:111 (-),score=12.40 gnl/TRDRNA2_/TRDRNA2_173422_c5_seq1:442-774(-)
MLNLLASCSAAFGNALHRGTSDRPAFANAHARLTILSTSNLLIDRSTFSDIARNSCKLKHRTIPKAQAELARPYAVNSSMSCSAATINTLKSYASALIAVENAHAVFASC